MSYNSKEPTIYRVLPYIEQRIKENHVKCTFFLKGLKYSHFVWLKVIRYDQSFFKNLSSKLFKKFFFYKLTLIIVNWKDTKGNKKIFY